MERHSGPQLRCCINANQPVPKHLTTGRHLPGPQREPFLVAAQADQVRASGAFDQVSDAEQLVAMDEAFVRGAHFVDAPHQLVSQSCRQT